MVLKCKRDDGGSVIWDARARIKKIKLLTVCLPLPLSTALTKPDTSSLPLSSPNYSVCLLAKHCVWD